MYTQCPDCATAFRVTADILKQASGKVRCGGCGIAFNALVYLSETKPYAPAPPHNDDALPELTPDPPEEIDKTEPPPAISAEQSAALLKTLDELAGSDIRLEDTGVEWRLLADYEGDDDEDAVQLSDDTETPVDAELSADTGNTAVDEILDDTPADVDEYLADAPGEVDAGELFEAAEDEIESPEIFDSDADTGVIDERLEDIDDQVEIPAETEDDELRFDDYTGLPDDESREASESASVVAIEDHLEPEPEPEFIEPSGHTETQVDIVFGDPDDWGELLDEVEVDPEDVEEAVEVRGAIVGPEAEDDEHEATELTIEDELDALEDEPPDAAEPIAADNEPIPESTSELESELARAQDLSDRIRTVLSRHGVDDMEDIDDVDNPVLVDDSGDPSSDFDVLFPDLDDEDDADEDLPELEPATAEQDDEAGDDFEFDVEFDEESDDTPDLPEPVILPGSEDEQTINRLIDQDLLRQDAGDDSDADRADEAAAGIDVPGFPAMDSSVETIIMEGEFVRTALEQEALEAEAARNPKPQENAFIAAAKKTFSGKLSEFEDEDETPERRSKHRIAAGVGLLGLLLAAQLVHQSRAELATIPAVNNLITPIYRMIGSPIMPHWDVTGWKFEVTRETLSGGAPIATDAAGPTTDDDASENDDAGDDDASATDRAAGAGAPQTPEVLTIYSRLGNGADQALPYPLITVALTDRYEETIGSTILDPGDYLPANADTTYMVTPGETFEAVIPIASPSDDATGYKLNVCYRLRDTKLRCAVADFK